MKEKFTQIIKKQETIALATSVNNVPNVRIINYVYLEIEKILYFLSFKGDKKEQEFEKNNIIAFSTIPKTDSSYIRVNHGIVQKSSKTINEIKHLFIEKWNWYENFIEKNHDKIRVYEIELKSVTVYPDPDKGYEIEL